MQDQIIEGFRLSPQQKALFDAKQCREAVAQGSLWFQGCLDHDRLHQSLVAIIEEHEAFRTRFHGLGDLVTPLQMVEESSVVLMNRRACAVEDPERIAACMREEAEQPFDLKEDPPIRFLLLSFGDQRHLLICTLAALSADAQTLDNLIEEISIRYSGSPDSLAYADDEEGPIQYIQFSEWQNTLDEEDDADRGLAFWRRFLETEPEAPRLPWQNRAEATTFQPEEVRFSLDIQQGFEGQEPAFFLSCWIDYLVRLTQAEELPMRICFDGRSLEELRPAMGLFTTPAPLRIQPNNRWTLAQMVAHVARQYEEAERFAEFYPHEEAPLHQESWALAFEYRQRHVQDDCFPKIQVHQRRWVTEPFKLKLIVEDFGQTQMFRLCFDASLFDQESLKRWAADLAHLLITAAEHPQISVAHLPHIAPQNQDLLLHDWGEGPAIQETGLEYANLVDAFHAAVRRYGARTAVMDDERSLSFTELNQLATALADELQRQGVQAGTPVPLMCQRGVLSLVGLWGILKAGGAYVPIDPNQPKPRRDLILASLSSNLIVTESKLADLFSEGDSLILLDGLNADGLKADARTYCTPVIHPLSPAYVLFTSGSTGTPKGVVVQQGSVLHLARALQTDIFGEESDPQRVSLNANLFFDSSVKQLTRTLFGHTLVIPSEETRADGRLFSQWLADQDTQVLDCTPSQFKYLLDVGLPNCLRRVLLGGEAIDQTLWDVLLAKGRNVRFFNVYGPTECTVNAVWGEIKDDHPNLGRPIPYTQITLRDNLGYLQPPGGMGELCISGPGVSSGYLGDPAKTAETFIPNPNSRIAGDRTYRSGDLGMFTPTGELVFMGRCDHQVKLHGIRMELGEIESTIKQCEGVRDAAVGLTNDGETRLIGYVVANRDALLETEAAHGEQDTESRHLLPNGLAVCQQNQNETEYLYDEIFNKLTYVMYGVTLPERAVIFDVGANIGMFSLFVMHHCTQPTIYAFEPLKPIYDILAQNLKDPSVKLFNLGCSDEEQQVDFNYYPHYSMMSSASEYAKPEDEVGVVKRFLELEAESGKEDAQELLDHADDLLEFRFEGETHRCRLRRLCDLIQEEAVTHIDLLKVDVQRAELDVLRGLTQENWDMIDQVVMEVHQESKGETANRVEEIESLLRRFGFDVVTEQDALLVGTDRYNLYARKAGLAGREERLDDYRRQAHEQTARPVTLSEESLLAFLGDRLPRPMLPSTILFLDALPLNRNGKIDRKALPQPNTRGVAYREASTPLEAQLTELWRDVFGQTDIGVDDNFFRLGGHSLLATQLISRIRRACDIDFPLRLLFGAPTIALMALEMEAIAGSVAPETPAIEPVSRDEDGLPLSFAQQRLWFIDQLEPGGTMYLNPFAIACRGPLQVGALDQAMVTLVTRHEIFRTRYVSHEKHTGEARQIVEPVAASYIDFIDLSQEPEDVGKQTAQEIVAQEANTPFDLSTVPLFRFKVVRLTQDHHLLLFTTHHIACDEWSLQLMVREINHLYAAFVAEEPHGLTTPDLQYVDFAVWQRNWLRGPVLEQHLDFWRRSLADIPPLLNLPVDFARSSVRTYRGRRQRLDLDPSFYERLNELIRKHDATAFMTYLAALSVLLARYSGQDDICIGTPTAGRSRIETENLLGCFINMLVIRAQLGDKPSFDALIEGIKARALEAFAHGDLPFEKLVESLGVPHDMDHSPIFQVALHVDDDRHRDTVADAQALALVGTESEAVGKQSNDSVARYDLVVTIAHRRDQVTLLFNYSRDLFEDQTITTMMEHFRELLDKLVAQPESPVDALTLEATRERQIAADHLRRQRQAAPWSSPLEAFAQAVQNTPEAAALTAAGDTLTFKALDRLANQIAHALRRTGVGPDQVVGICADRHSGLIAAMLGVLKAGGAYLPLDPQYPQSRIEQLIDVARPTVILAQTKMQHLLTSFENVLLLDGEQACHLDQPTSAPTSRISGEHLAYVLFTSGSTGTPKGVMVRHASLANLWSALQRIITPYGENHHLRVGLNAPLAFDSSVKQWLTLCGGHHLHLVPEDTRTDVAALVQFVRHHRLDVMDVTPSMLDLLLDAGITEGSQAPSEFTPSEFTPSEFTPSEFTPSEFTPSEFTPSDILVGGEPITTTLWKRLQAIPNTRFHNVYGPTECTVDSTHQLLTPSQNIPVIGTPLANCAAYVLDRDLQPVPVGQIGELYIGGLGLSRGYLFEPSLTAAHFLPNPFAGQTEGLSADDAGGRLYRTGDLVRRRTNGALEFLGRRDHQVKIRGHRVELHEIEHHLNQHPCVRTTVALLDEGQLVAFVIPTEHEQASSSSLQDWMGERLPSYLVPSQIISVTAIPRTHHQKIDRTALLKLSRDNQTQTRIQAQDMIEETLIQILSKLLGIGAIDPGQKFFELGGHSLVAIQLVARIRKVFSVVVKLRDIFDQPKISDLANLIRKRLREHAGVQTPAISPVDRSLPLPLSSSQQRLWFLDQLDPGNPVYNSPKVVALEDVDGRALEAALNQLVERHEILRTRFPSFDDQPRQIVEPYRPKSLPVIDLSELPGDQRMETARALIKAEAAHRFNLAQGPLTRFRLLRLGSDEHLLSFNMHHIVTDARSLQILWKEAQALYDARLQGEDALLGKPELQYGDYAVHQQQWFQDRRFDEQIAWWKERLQDIPVLDLPLDRPRPPVQTMAGSKHGCTLDAQTSDRLRRLAKQSGATPFMALLAGFKAFLSRICHQQDIAVGVPASGRTLLTSEDIVGCFINTLVLRSHLHQGCTYAELLEQVRETAIGAFTHQDVPFEKLVEALSPTRDTSHSPLFQVFYNHRETDTPPVQNGAFKMETAVAKFDLTLHVSHHPDAAIAMVFEYKTALFDETSMANLARCFSHFMDVLTTHPNQAMASMSLLPADQAHASAAIHDGQNESLSQQPISRQFETLARHTPAALGLVFGEQRWTYDVLNQAANRLAHHLMSMANTQECLVAVFLERGLEMVTSLLAIQKAGCAYLPIDPSYPADRVSYMLADAATPIIVTRSNLTDRLPAGDATVICLDRDHERASWPTTDPNTTIHPEQLAYVIYTSGSTGRPKGVQISHGALTNFIATMAVQPGIETGDRLLAVTTISFDIAGLELYLPLTQGATLIMADAETSTDATALANLIQTHDVTIMQATPVTWLMLRNSGWRGKANLKALCGGEALSADLASFLVQVCSQVWNLYGPTETTIWSSRHRVDQQDGGESKAVQLGEPIAHTSLHVLDPYLNPTPQGINGQLFIGGQGLARGYRNQAARTAERFIPDACSGQAGARLYATGDLVRRRQDVLHFQGRNDYQVKIRGFRIELGEIQTNLNRHEGVKECIVLIHRPRPDDARLIAFMIPSRQKPAVADLRHFLGRHMPEYMIPAAYHFIDQWPQTLNGKIDQRALMERAANRQLADEVVIHPRTDREWLIWRIFAELLGTRHFGVKESFFHLGGHSLLAISLVTRIEEATGRKLPLTSIFGLNSVEALADAIGDHDVGEELTHVKLWSGSEDVTPIFWAPPQGGTAFCYADLAARLTPARTSYGFNAPGLSPGTEPLESITQLAEHYADELARIQPEGPVSLGGWSFGGLIAFELARLLERRGRQVQHLLIIDTFLPLEHTYGRQLTEREQLLGFIASLDTNLDELGLDLSGDWRPQDVFERLLAHAKDAGILPVGTQTEQIARHFRVHSAHSKAARTYEPNLYAGDVLFMHISQPRPEKLAHWRVVASRVETVEVAGEHHQLLAPPYVADIADHVACFLA